MSSPAIPRPRINDLWAAAAAQLSSDDRRNINFSCPDKLGVLKEILGVVQKSKQECIDKQWRCRRKSGETVIIRDVFEKIVKYIDRFKQIGDIAIQYDPVHAALPWAGVRFVLQIVLGDFAKYNFMFEGIASIAEIISRYAIVESLYLNHASEASGVRTEIERALVTLYAAVLVLLAKTNSYFDQNTAVRVTKSGFGRQDFESYLTSIIAARQETDRCQILIERNDQVENHAKLEHLLQSIDGPLIRMNKALEILQDNLDEPKRKEILRWLSSEPYLQYHNQTKQDVLSGTGEWLLSDPVFDKWQNESVSSILWLHGIPGSGKSKLVSIVVEDAMQKSNTGQYRQPAFFYCSRNPAELKRSSPEIVLASIAKQLSTLGPSRPILDPTTKVYRDREAQDFASGPLRLEESRALIVQLAEHYPLIIIMIDALDECDPEKRDDLLEALEKILLDCASLVKIFVSSRNDQDIVLRLQHYPNLEIDSHKNSNDIANFVNAETKKLVQKQKLLRYSQNRSDMEELIVDKVTTGANGMFRWASLQLQYLCSFKLDADIHKQLGKLPPKLETLYSELYDILSNTSAEAENRIVKNVFSLLLCVQQTLKTTEFLIAASIISSHRSESVGKDLLLALCNNFVVFDAQLDIFRFTHLSVREFLEKRAEYTNSSANGLVAEICLCHMISIPNAAAQLSPELQRRYTSLSYPSIYRFTDYSMFYWATHCQLAAEYRDTNGLKDLLWSFLSSEENTSSTFSLWVAKMQSLSKRYEIPEQLTRLEDAIATQNTAFFVVCAFDLPGFIAPQKEKRGIQPDAMNSRGLAAMHICAKHGSLNIMSAFFDRHDLDIKVTEEVVKAAAGNDNGKEVMALLLDRRGDDIEITEEVVKAAAGNWNNSKEIMALLLDRRGDDIKITEKVVKAAAGNWNNSKEIMALLLDRRGDDIEITEEVVKVAAGNDNGKEVMTLLFDRRGHNIEITKEVVKAAAGNLYNGKEVMALLLDRRGDNIEITEKVVKAVADNL